MARKYLFKTVSIKVKPIENKEEIELDSVEIKDVRIFKCWNELQEKYWSNLQLQVFFLKSSTKRKVRSQKSRRSLSKIQSSGGEP